MKKHVAAAVAAAALALPSCGSAQRPAMATRSQCVVARVADGDTFTCTDGRRVRLIGIDTPELRQGESGRQALEALSRFLPENTAVGLETDAAPRDRYSRVLAYVWVGSRLVNEAMVRDGWAMLYTVPPNVRHAERLEQAQREARNARAGLWSAGGFDCSPEGFRRGECGRAAP
jgi:micrococcal nuclease